MEKFTRIIDSGSNADMFYLDFAKAFDKVPHARLLEKLQSKGVGGQLLKWIEDWLKGRTQRVKVGGELSEKCSVESGVLQGTVLGPPLFVVYIDNLEEAKEELDLILKFADDTKGLQEIRGIDDNRKLQTALDKLVEWADRWAMQFNVKKCKIIHMGNNNQKHV